LRQLQRIAGVLRAFLFRYSIYGKNGVITDATVAPQAIHYPTELSLLMKPGSSVAIQAQKKHCGGLSELIVFVMFNFHS